MKTFADDPAAVYDHGLVFGVSDALDAQTFRNIAKSSRPMVVNIQTEMKAKGNEDPQLARLP